MQRTFSNEFIFQLFSLLLSVLIVHAIYVTVIWPNAQAEIEQNRAMMQAGCELHAAAFLVHRPEGLRAGIVLRARPLGAVDHGLQDAQRQSASGGSSTRSWCRSPRACASCPKTPATTSARLQALPPAERGLLLPRALLNALQRFGATRNVQDASSAAHTVVMSEAERLEAELSMVRYILWAIPSIGFIGTVRGIGDALSVANKAVSGDISGVTESLGVAFNSTLIALLISILLMFLVHQLQLLQERLSFETENYLDEQLIRHLQAN